MLNKKHYIIFILFIVSTLAYSQHRSYTDKYEYRKKRHEVNIGLGASNCLTDLGGNFSVNPSSSINSKISDENSNQIKFLRSIYDTDLAKSNFSINAAYIYHFKRKLNFRANLAFARVGADDKESTDLGRINRNLNFRSNILEISAITEYYFAKPLTGNKYNLKDVQGHKLAPNFLAHWGFYLFGGVGGFFFNPKGQNLLNYDSTFFNNSGFTPQSSNSSWIALHPLRTEGQGSESSDSFTSITDVIETELNNDTFQIKTFKPGKSYSRVAVCFPLGFGFEKAFNSDMGLKIEAGYRFTLTDYLDDVSGVYADRESITNAIKDKNNASLAHTMSGTYSGNYTSHIHFTNRDPSSTASGPPGIEGAVWVNSDPTDLSLYGNRAYYINQTSFDPKAQRGNPMSNDSYMFVNLSVYKKFSSHTKWYRDAHKNDKRRIKASF
tara:strand:+ start:559 stop:1872 length:1314 start_codon:yes stop_codon:yes gene_type:complete